MVEADGVVLVAASLLLSLYTFYVLRALPAGQDRLLFALPLIPMLLALPWLFDPEHQPASVALTAWILTWLGGFKVLSFCFGRGILASDWNSLSFLRFHLSLSLPVHIRPVPSSAPGQRHNTANHSQDKQKVSQDSQDEGPQGMVEGLRARASRKQEAAASSDQQAAGRSAVTSREDQQALREGLQGALLSSALHGVLFYFNLQLYNIPSLPLMAVELVHCLSILLFLTAICDAVAALAKVLAGLDIQPYFNKPYLARSFGDFWARRWNITVSSCLRDAVYDPTLELLRRKCQVDGQHAGAATLDTKQAGVVATGGPVQQAAAANGDEKQSMASSSRAKARWPQACGVLATFLVSGIMHELIVYYVTREVTGEMILFFGLHGAFVTVESVLRGKGLLRDVPAFVSVPFVVGTTFLTAHMLFFPPFIRSAATDRVIWQVKGWLGQAM